VRTSGNCGSVQKSFRPLEIIASYRLAGTRFRA
jgi:hypothetical protein